MSTDPEEDLEAQRLADYSEAVRRGQPDDLRGIDPRDAAIIRRLQALGGSKMPSADYIARAQGLLAETPEPESRTRTEPKELRPGPSPSLEPASGFTGHQIDASTREGRSQFDRTSEREPVPIPRSNGGRLSWSAIAAGLTVLIAAGALVLYLIASLRGNDNAAQNTVVPTPSSAIVPTSVPNVAATPSPSKSKSFLLYPKFAEQSSVGKHTPIMEAFRPIELTIPWDGIGMVILSGCPDSACNYVLDDELQIVVTNPERKEATVWVSDNGTENGESRGLPIVLTNLFRSGENVVHANLIDRAGDQRGARTPIYIVILS
jgi:hypothetical protein